MINDLSEPYLALRTCFTRWANLVLPNGEFFKTSKAIFHSFSHCTLLTGVGVCGCIHLCDGAEKMEFCGTDMYTYQSICEMHKRTCEVHGVDSDVNITMAHHGPCKYLACRSSCCRNYESSSFLVFILIPHLQSCFLVHSFHFLGY